MYNVVEGFDIWLHTVQRFTTTTVVMVVVDGSGFWFLYFFWVRPECRYTEWGGGWVELFMVLLVAFLTSTRRTRACPSGRPYGPMKRRPCHGCN